VVFAVAQVTTLDEVLELPLVEAAVGAVQLEGPQEVRGLLKVGADGVDLVDEILHTDHAVLSEVLLDDLVVSQRQALLVNLAISALVDEFANGLLVGVTVGNERLDDLQHLQGGLGELNEDTVVDLQQTEQLQSLALLGINLVDTLDADDESKLVLLGHVELVLLLGLALQTNLLAVGIAVLLDVLFSTLEDDLALVLVLV